MKRKDILKLRKGNFVDHKHLGLCIVDELNEIGIVVRPLSGVGYNKLAFQSGVLFNRLLEDSVRMIVSAVENPVIPLLIVQNEDGFPVFEWVELGEVSAKGVFSAKKVKCFDSPEPAMKYVGENQKTYADWLRLTDTAVNKIVSGSEGTL